MSFSALVSRAWNRNLLLSVLIELTYDCNFRCEFCYNDAERRGRALSFERYQALFDELGKAQVLYLTLSGGEPLRHPRFFSIAEAAKALGFALRIKTNGHSLRGMTLERMQKLDPYLVEVSLHGSSPYTHDRQTRVRGSFDRLLENLRLARDAGLRCKLNATLTKYNQHELESMFDLADRLRLTLHVDPDVTPCDDGDRSPLALAPDIAAVERLRSIVRTRAKSAEPSLDRNGEEARAPGVEGTRIQSDNVAEETRIGSRSRPAIEETRTHCGAGVSTLAIDPFGEVYPCVQWRRSLGNLWEASLVDILAGDARARVRADNMAAKTRLGRPTLDQTVFLSCPGVEEALSKRERPRERPSQAPMDLATNLRLAVLSSGGSANNSALSWAIDSDDTD